MPLNRERLKAQRRDTEGEGSPDIMRLKDGKNYIRVFSFQHKVTERDFAVRLYKKGANAPKVGSIETEISRLTMVHLQQGSGPTNCFLDKSNCELCQEARASAAEGNPNAKRMRAQPRNAINVVDMSNAKDGIKRLDLGPQAFEGLLDQYFDKIDDGVPDDEIFGCNGRDFIITYNKGTSDISKTYVVTMRDKERCEKLPAELVNNVKDMFKVSVLDPQDAPPHDFKEETKSEPQKEEPKPDPKSVISEERKEEIAEKEDGPLPFGGDKTETVGTTEPSPEVAKKLEGLEDSKSGSYRVGDIITFDLDGKKIPAKIEKINGSVYTARDMEGAPWELDENEIIPF